MDRSLIPVLAEVLELYYDYIELMELASIFEITWTFEIFAGSQFRWLRVARQLVEQIDRGNHHAMLEALLDALEQRNMTAIARTDWERRDAHETARGKIEKLIAALREPGIAREIVVAENKPRWKLVRDEISKLPEYNREGLRLLLEYSSLTDYTALQKLGQLARQNSLASVLPGLQNQTGLIRPVPGQPASRQPEYELHFEIAPELRPFVERYFNEMQ